MNRAAIQKLLNEESFKDLFDNAHDLIQIVDIDSNIIYANNSWTTVLECSLEEIQGRSIYSMVAPEDLQRFKEYREAIINGEVFNSEIIVRYLTSTGKSVFLEGFISLRKKNEQPFYTRGIFRDITAKMQHEAALMERENNLQQLLLNAPDAIIVINKESLITFWNPQAEKMFGWSAGEVMNEQLSEKIIPLQFREAHHHGLERYLTTGKAFVLNKTVELTALKKSGEEFHVSLTISTTTQNGELAFIAFLRDIQEQKKNEAELEIKRKELETSNRQLEQFAHVASHDMKEPIRKIKLFMGMLESSMDNALDEKQKNYFDKINSSAQRLQSMVEGVLNYATTSSINESMELVDLNNVIKSIESDLEVLIAEKQASIDYHALPAVMGIEFLIYQLFYNLINNSLKFSKQDVKPVISITTKATMDDVTKPQEAAVPVKSFVEIIIADNGIGFEQEYAEKIFQTFTRLNNRTLYEGTGLGLSLCRLIMERHHGFITAESEQGIGATFTLLFPVFR